MFRQSPRSRNVRKRGLKIKHVLQISVLFGASIWLLYQVQHTDDKKPQVATKVSENLHQDGTNGMIKLGRKGLRPRGKETNVQDKKETTTDHGTDEDDNVNEGEELRVQGHDQDEDAKQEEVGEIANTDDGMGKNTKRGYEELKVEMKGDENEEAKEKEDGVKDEKKQNHDDGNGSKNEEAKKKEDGVKDEKKQNHDDGNGSKNEELATIEVDGNKKSEEEENMNIPSKENNKESAQESKNEDGNQMQPNPEEMVEIISPPEDDDQNAREEVTGNGEKRRDNGSSSKGPSVDESESSGLSPSHSETNEEDKGSSSNTTTASEGETSTTGGTKLVRNRKIGNLPRKRMWIKSVKKNTSPDSHLVPKKNEGK